MKAYEPNNLFFNQFLVCELLGIDKFLSNELRNGLAFVR